MIFNASSLSHSLYPFVPQTNTQISSLYLLYHFLSKDKKELAFERDILFSSTSLTFHSFFTVCIFSDGSFVKKNISHSFPNSLAYPLSLYIIRISSPLLLNFSLPWRSIKRWKEWWWTKYTHSFSTTKNQNGELVSVTSSFFLQICILFLRQNIFFSIWIALIRMKWKWQNIVPVLTFYCLWYHISIHLSHSTEKPSFLFNSILSHLKFLPSQPFWNSWS